MFIIKPQSQCMYKNSILAAILNLAAILRHIAVILILKNIGLYSAWQKKQFLFLPNKYSWH